MLLFCKSDSLCLLILWKFFSHTTVTNGFGAQKTWPLHWTTYCVSMPISFPKRWEKEILGLDIEKNNEGSMLWLLFTATFTNFLQTVIFFFELAILCMSQKRKFLVNFFGEIFFINHNNGRRSMLWSQFSAIFAYFRRRNWRFSLKPMLWSKFCII
jgi:hypothetical protein